jgi:hypothetical protein
MSLETGFIIFLCSEHLGSVVIVVVVLFLYFALKFYFEGTIFVRAGSLRAMLTGLQVLLLSLEALRFFGPSRTSSPSCGPRI